MIASAMYQLCDLLFLTSLKIYWLKITKSFANMADVPFVSSIRVRQILSSVIATSLAQSEKK